MYTVCHVMHFIGEVGTIEGTFGTSGKFRVYVSGRWYMI